MKWRDFRPQDLMECLDVNPDHVGDEIVGRSRAVAAWKELIRNSGFHSVVVEGERIGARPAILGFGAGVFVSRAFADDEVAAPRPGLNSRIISSICNRGSALLTDAEIRSANSGQGLDVAILCGTSRHGRLEADDFSAILSLLAQGWLEQYAGYRLNRLLTETIGTEERRAFEATHAFRFLDGARTANDERRLAVVTREDARSVTASVVSLVFSYRPPVLALRDADQRFLLAALKGATDGELARKLGSTVFAIKKRWTSIFEHTFGVRPDLFPDVALNETGQTRGRQKRHHLLAYMRAHPEELRPVERLASSRPSPRSRQLS